MVGTIVKLLKANPAVMSKVANVNIVPLTMPQGMKPPCLIYFTETEPIIGCDSGTSITRASVTIQVITTTMAELLELSPEIIKSLKGKREADLLHCSLVDAGADDYDEDNSYYFRSIQFNCISEI